MKLTWLRPLCAGALALTSLLAHAQYSWIDDKGARVFSDRPPPPGTPAARILKMPRGLEPAPAAAAPAAQQPAPSWVEREADYRKRAEERGKEQEKTAAAGKQRSAQCDAARAELANLHSGVRLMRVDKHGEREFVSDEERARRQDQARRALAQCP